MGLSQRGFINQCSKVPKKAKLYRMYHCMLSSTNKSRSVAASKSTAPDLTQRNFGCKASVAFWIMEGDDYALKGMPAKVHVKWDHNHALDSAHFLSLLRPLEETRKKYDDYFADGHSVNSAIATHTNSFQTVDQMESARLRASKAHNPTKNVVWHWYQDWRRERFASWLGSHDALLKNEQSILDSGILFRMLKEPFAVMVVTPLMQRAHQMASSADITFVDSTSTCDAENHSLTFMLAQSCVGAIPLAVFITSDQTEKSYVAAFTLLKEVMATAAFGGTGSPRVFLTDDAVAEKNALAAVWPDADRMNCVFHIAQAQWRWLWDGKNKIQQGHRKELMNDFRSIMFSATESDALEALNNAMLNMQKLEEENYSLAHCADRLRKLWDRRYD